MGLDKLSLASLVLGISKADIASVPGSLCKVMAATNVCNFLCLQATGKLEGLAYK